MEQTPKRKYRLILDFKAQFPEKLYDVANDGYLIQWNRDDSVSIRDEEEFEEKVMTLYPGFLQNSTTLNLKRLFREYAFDRDIGPNGILKFSHPCFQRGRRQLLSEIRTRRKSFRKPQYTNNEDANGSGLIEAEEGKRYPTRKRRRTTRLNVSGTVANSEQSDKRGWGDYIESSPVAFHIRKPFNTPTKVEGSEQHVPKVNVVNEIRHRIMNTFSKNEFNEQEYQVWVNKQRQMDELKAKKEEEVKTENKSKFWWMYGDKQEPSDTTNKNSTHGTNDTGVPDQDSCMPCGFCKCCSAISNYVHIFGEVPENIQVYDIVEEVFEADDGASTQSSDSLQLCTSD